LLNAPTRHADGTSGLHATTVGDLLIDRLCAWGGDTIFGLPGDGIIGIFEAL
jgi:hypothetical protein